MYTGKRDTKELYDFIFKAKSRDLPKNSIPDVTRASQGRDEERTGFSPSIKLVSPQENAHVERFRRSREKATKQFNRHETGSM